MGTRAHAAFRAGCYRFSRWPSRASREHVAGVVLLVVSGACANLGGRVPR